MRLSELELPNLPKKLDSAYLTSDEEKALEYIKKFTPTAFEKAKEGHIIYRGMEPSKSKNFLYFDSSKYTRKSQNTYNYYTLLIDLLPSWKDMPKRSKSSICTTSLYTAREYGSLWYVLPFDDAKIGVCSKSDFWWSMEYLCSRFYCDSLEEFCDMLDNLFMWNKIQKPETPKQLVKALKKLNKMDIEYENYNTLKIPKGKFLPKIVDGFDPEKNKIKNINISNFKAEKTQEIFIEGKVFFVYIDLFKKLKGMK